MPNPALALVVDEQLHADEPPEAEAAPAPAAPTYEVQRRDTLWDIAERHLGDPFRWQEIYQLNEGCPQADGRCLADPDLIFAGWQLQLPSDAIGLAPPPAPEPAPAPTSPPEQTSPSGPGQSSVVIDGGMVLIDDGGAPAVGGDVLLAADEAPDGRADGMVLLPDGPAPADRCPTSGRLAGPPAGRGRSVRRRGTTRSLPGPTSRAAPARPRRLQSPSDGLDHPPPRNLLPATAWCRHHPGGSPPARWSWRCRHPRDRRLGAGFVVLWRTPAARAGAALRNNVVAGQTIQAAI